MKHILLYIGIICLGLSATLQACTDLERARSMGGTVTITVPVNCIVIGATWKESVLWYTTKDTTTGEVVLREQCSYGNNGKVIFK